jgi:hypothetical protein
MEISQAAADVIPRIKELETLSGEDLETAMLQLKGALLQNPDAVALMLPEDIGMMVVALRRMTGQSIAEATAEKKTGTKKSKAKMLTAEEMAAAFDEL